MVKGTAFYGVVGVEYLSVKSTCTVGFVAELSGEGKVQKTTFFTQFGTIVDVQLTLCSVKATAVVISRRGKVSAITYLGREAFVFLKLKVHHPSNSIGTILGGSPIAQHLYFGKGEGGNGIKVSPNGTTPRRTIDIDKGGGVSAFSVQ